MKILRVLLLVILCIVLAAGLTGLQAATDILVMARPEPYVSAVKAGGLFEKLPRLVVGVFGPELDLPDSEMARVVAALEETCPPEWVEAEVTAFVGEVAWVLKGRAAEPTYELPIDDISDRFLAAYAKTASPVGFARVRLAVENIRGEEGLGDLGNLAVDSGPLEGVSRLVRLASGGVGVLGAVCLVLVTLMFLLAGGLPGGARWAGAACFASGLVGLAVSFLGTIILPGFAQGFSAGGASPEGTAVAGATVMALARTLVRTVRTTAIGALAAGVVLFVLAAIIQRARARREAEVKA